MPGPSPDRPVHTGRRAAFDYVALTNSGGFDESWHDAPAVAKAAAGWRRKHIVSGHWPMVSAFDAALELLESECRHYAAERN